jgi:hypothetical protein
MTRPSLSDFGTYDESTVPRLWDGVIGAWMPSLGPTGQKVYDLSGRGTWQAAASVPTYTLQDGIIGVQGNAGLSAVTPAHYLGLTEATLAVMMYKSAQSDLVSVAGLTGSNNSRFGFSWASSGIMYVTISSEGGNQYYSFSQLGSGYCLAVTQFKATTARVTVNNVQKINTASAVSQLRTTASTSSITTDGFSTSSANAICFGMVMWNRRVADDEVSEINNLNLVGMFQRRRVRRGYVSEAAAVKSYLFLNRGQVIGGGIR